VAGLVRQPRRADQVADRIDTLLAGLQPFVDDDVAALDLHLRAVQADVLDVSGDPDRQHDAVDGDRLALAAGLDRRADAVLARLQVGDLRAGMDLEALLLERLLREGRYLLVLLRQDAVEYLRDRHLGAHVRVEAGELHADGARADHQQRLRHEVRNHRLAIGPDQLAVRLQPRKGAGTGAGRQDDVLRREVADGLAVLLHLQLAGAVQTGMPVDDGDLVLLEQIADAAGQLLGHPARALHHLCEVETDVLGGEAVGVEIVQDVVDLRRAQQRLRRDAAPVQADAAQMLALHHSGLHAELRGADGGDVAARPAANDDQVEAGLCHGWLLFRCGRRAVPTAALPPGTRSGS